MKITVAKSAGFCFGVTRAMKLVFGLLEEGKSVCTLGPIIHNPQTLSELEKRGVKIVDMPAQTPKGFTLVVRSHGVAKQIWDEIAALKLDTVDATCPFVEKIHSLVAKASAQGKTILIAGDVTHPEVQGIRGYCDNVFVFKDAAELKKLFKQNFNLENKSVCIVAQTTFNIAEWENCLEIIKRVYTNAAIFDTICNATTKRQSEAVKLSEQCDAMIVIGGRQSSNTARYCD